jgi:hypothetical protein
VVAPVARTEYFPTFGDAHELHVELRGIRPKIWRSLQVPLQYSLNELHDILQVAFGWQNSHLLDYEVDGIRFGMTDVEDDAWEPDDRQPNPTKKPLLPALGCHGPGSALPVRRGQAGSSGTGGAHTDGSGADPSRTRLGERGLNWVNFAGKRQV